MSDEEQKAKVLAARAEVWLSVFRVVAEMDRNQERSPRAPIDALIAATDYAVSGIA